MRKNIENKPGIVLLIVLVGFPQISETIFTPSLPQIATFYNTSMGVTQLTLSIYFLAFALGVFTWGWLSDIIGRRGAMNAGIILYGVGSILCYLSPTITFLLVARFIQAFGASTGSITTQTILREAFSDQERHHLFAQISAALAFTPALGPLIGGIVGQYYGFKGVFLTLIVMSVVLFSYSYARLPETYQPESRKKVSILNVTKRLLHSPRVLTFGLLIGVINGLLFSYYAEAPYVFIEVFGMSQSHYGFLGLVVALATILGALSSKRQLAKKTPEHIIQSGLKVGLLGAFLLLLVVAIIPKVTVMMMVCYIFAIFVILFGTGMALPNCLSLALIDFKEEIGTAGAVFSLGYYLLVSLIILVMSLLHDGRLIMMPVYFIVLLTISCFLARKHI